MIAKYLYLAAALVFLAAIGVTGYLAYNAGIDHEKATTARLIEEEQAKQAKLREEVERFRADLAAETRKKVRVVRAAPDHTGCADMPIPTGIIEQLLPESGNSKTGLSADGRYVKTGAGR